MMRFLSAFAALLYLTPFRRAGARQRQKGPITKLGIKPFVGSLDEVSVWARGLTAAEVAELAK